MTTTIITRKIIGAARNYNGNDIAICYPSTRINLSEYVYRPIVIDLGHFVEWRHMTLNIYIYLITNIRVAHTDYSNGSNNYESVCRKDFCHISVHAL